MSSDERLTWDLTDSFNDDFSNYSKVENRNSARENQAFIYPGPYARNISGTNKDAKMRRGFMRSIIMGDDIAKQFGVTGPGNLRLNFQFNPEYIERRVSQSPGAVNPLLQNPANLTQAVPGTAQFNFTMTFNREAEVALSNDRLSFDSTIDDEDGIRDGLKDPGKVGVMHDLAIFDKIIGQGISEELVNIITAYTRQQTVANNNAAASNVNNDDDDSSSAITEFNETAFRDSINANFGNSAFLNPMPVRIVFSDLFMVEGLIVGSAVAFQKFSQNMIPTVCQVNCEVYALYVGFAKKKAFLTNNLTDWATASAIEAAKVTSATNAGRLGMTRRVKKLTFQYNFTHEESDGYFKTPVATSYPMQILKPVSPGNYYAGNTVGNDDERFITLPQWYNTFTGTVLRQNDSHPGPSGDVTLQLRNAYNSEQSEQWLNKLPIAIYMEYERIPGSSTNTGPDADFDFKVSLHEFRNGVPRSKPLAGQLQFVKWKKVNGTNENKKRPSWIGNSLDQSKDDLFYNVYWVNLRNVINGNEIANDSRCEFRWDLSMSQTVAGVPTPVKVTFNTIAHSYSPSSPLWRQGPPLTGTDQRSSADVVKINRPGYGTVVTGRR